MRKLENLTVIYLDEGDFITGLDVKNKNILSGLLPEVEKDVLLCPLVIYKGQVLKDRNHA